MKNRTKQLLLCVGALTLIGVAVAVAERWHDFSYASFVAIALCVIALCVIALCVIATDMSYYAGRLKERLNRER